MKKTLISLTVAALIGGMAGNALAIPFEINVGGVGGSSVSVTDSSSRATLTGTLAFGADDLSFGLGNGESKEIDFFTLKATGFTLGASYEVEAKLAFTTPTIGPAVGEGGGTFWTIFGLVSGGYLDWGNTTPQTFAITNGPTIMIAFEEGAKIVWGNTTTIHATITNLGGGSGTAAAVPEPNTLLLLGAGLVGLAVSSRRKSKKN